MQILNGPRRSKQTKSRLQVEADNGQWLVLMKLRHFQETG